MVYIAFLVYFIRLHGKKTRYSKKAAGTAVPAAKGRVLSIASRVIPLPTSFLTMPGRCQILQGSINNTIKSSTSCD